ncbi:hypothetical protein [Clostridium neonatale]|uniref:DUF1515 domain-containing protein n=2 Tax=root TaxID=1 RepID=A0AAD1YKP2_9CLOT|nr:hypothetical protein [Clostridium neonatale]DAF94618.1 MAG TPA: hypothetical protein [Siphoviridae sp. ct3gT1]CAG9714680.1 conserved hypothetical protein [Clostridium neonatale]CAI3211753.1 DUF1515 domain-containing protein [Clostridium neonatale]CAI3214573.1 DUF1515 domain-containing protein [Clostridium neonatale]CAI3215868.1 DUF1515 domain-containing protein [Clostridium neonatale]
MDKEILEILKQLQVGQQETNKRLTNIENEIKSFKEQFTDFEGKSASNHIEVVNKLDNMQKDLNAMEVVTSKNWNDIAQLKAIK